MDAATGSARDMAGDLLRRLADEAGLLPFSGPMGCAPFWDRQSVEGHVAATPALHAVMARLFLAGAEIGAADVCAALGASSTDLLLRAGVLRLGADGTIRSPHLLVSSFNRHVLAAPPPGHPFFDVDAAPYCGPESLWFAQFLALRGPYARCLDLCTGSGLLAMLPQADSVVAVDIDPAAIDIAALNLPFNRRDNIILRQGDLFEPAEDARFDLITANPPFLPSGPGGRLPACAGGGRRGDEVLGRILGDVAHHLAPGGEALIYAEGFGDREGPAIVADLPDMALSTRHAYTCWIGGTRNAQQRIFDLCRIWQIAGASEEDAWAHWRELASAMPVSHYHHAIWRVVEGSGTISVRRMRSG